MSNQKQTVTWDISWMSIIRVVVVLLGVYLIFDLFDILLTLFVVVILHAALSPLVDKIKLRFNVPRIMAILLIYLCMVIVVGIVGYLIVPPVIEQVQNLPIRLEKYSDKIGDLFASFTGDSAISSSSSIQSASSALGNVANTIVKSASSVFGGLTTVFYILILTLFLLLEEDGIRKFFVSLLPISEKNYIIDVSKKIGDKMGAWVLGQLTLMAIIGAITTLGLFVLRVDYALTLGVLAGLLEVIPTIGPIISAIPAVAIAYLTGSPWLAVAVLILYIVIQQLENQIVVPKVMQKALGISPFVVLVALLIGGKLAGTLGVILAVPTVATISVLSKEYPTIRRKL